MRFFRQGYWSGLPFPSLGELPNPGIEPRSPALQADSLTDWAIIHKRVHICVHNDKYIRHICLSVYLSISRASRVSQMVQNLPAVWETRVWSLGWEDLSVVIIQSLSGVWLFSTPWTAARQASLSSTISRSLLRFLSTELLMLSNHLILCHSLLLLPSILPSLRVFF